jgi:hypothetical protein
MVHICKDICHRYKAPHTLKSKRYENGQKFCDQCAVFIKWDGIWCPCCGHKLRVKPKMLRSKIGVVRIG